MGLRRQLKQLLRMCGHAFVGTVHERLDVLERQVNQLSVQNAALAETQNALLQASIALLGKRPGPDGELAPQVCVDARDYDFMNPETGLMAFLYSFLPGRKAIDVGAHVGEVSEALLRAGYEVFAFEPNPPVYEKLVRRLADRAGFHPFNFAIGARRGEAFLHLVKDLSETKRHKDETIFSSLVLHSMPEDLIVDSAIIVPVRSLADLHESGEIPVDISLVKIDTEGLDLDVVRGMGSHRYPVVVAEYWGVDTPFGGVAAPYTLENLVVEMRQLGYCHHIVIYRVYGPNQLGYYCDYGRSIPNTTGNVFFFREFDVFRQGQAWCSAALPRTYFTAAGTS